MGDMKAIIDLLLVAGYLFAKTFKNTYQKCQVKFYSQTQKTV